VTAAPPAGAVCSREGHATTLAAYLIETGAGPVAMCAPCARQARRADLGRLPKARLCAMLRRGVVTPAGGRARWIDGLHPPERWRKDEVAASIAVAEYPDPAAPPEVTP
jgi:hypothetical protein